MTDDYEHYEAVVVGAGPGGAAAAAMLARHDVETLVLERGVDAGSKNVSGGLIYAEESAPYTVDDLFPGFREAASERPVTENYIHNVAGRKVKSFDIGSLHHHDTEWADSVLRRPMDSWMAEQVHEMTRETGGGLLTDVRVNGLLRENGEIVGVTCDELDPIKADVVVAADGVNSELARDAGLMDWEEPEEWFQGVKAVVEMPPEEINERFNIRDDEGEAHLYSGNLFEGARGGGFLYTNRSSLSIGAVFHLDSIAEGKHEPHHLLDNLLTHPLLAEYFEGLEYNEIEYSAKLVPDSKKVAHESPHKDNLVLVGDAAGQMQAQGPIIKGMNHAVTGGALAAKAFVETRDSRQTAGERYAQKLRESGTMAKLRPDLYEKVTKPLAENKPMTNFTENLLDSKVGRLGLKAVDKTVGLDTFYSDPTLVSVIPDTRMPYVTMPTVIAQELGDRIEKDSSVEPPALDDRIGDLTYDTDIGNPHIEVLDNSWEASGTAVTACPVSAKDFGGGCYREETVKTNGTEEKVVSLDTQPCVECGTCAVIADTKWEHPRGGKGVEYKQG